MIPKPFKRNSISVGTRITRQWKQTTATRISVGDIVQGRGEVTGLVRSMTVTEVSFLNGTSHTYSNDETFSAFTEGEPVGHSK